METEICKTCNHLTGKLTHDHIEECECGKTRETLPPLHYDEPITFFDDEMK